MVRDVPRRHHRHGLPTGYGGDPCGELRVVGVERCAAHQYRSARLAYACAKFMDGGTGLCAADPLRVSATCGDASIKGAGEFEDDVGQVGELPREKIGHEVVAFLLADAHVHRDTVGAQVLGTATGYGIRVGESHHHTGDARLDDGVGTGRRLAVMVARFQRDDQSAVRGVDSFRRGVTQAFHLGMGFPVACVPAACDDFAVTHQHRPHGGVGGRVPASAFGEGDGLAHERGEIGAHA